MEAHANSTQPTERSYPKEEAVIAFQSNSSKFSSSTLHPSRRRGLFSMLALAMALLLAFATVPAKRMVDSWRETPEWKQRQAQMTQMGLSQIQGAFKIMRQMQVHRQQRYRP
jgi:hypothetical protein